MLDMLAKNTYPTNEVTEHSAAGEARLSTGLDAKDPALCPQLLLRQ